jgi:hypothetical protein
MISVATVYKCMTSLCVTIVWFLLELTIRSIHQVAAEVHCEAQSWLVRIALSYKRRVNLALHRDVCEASIQRSKRQS